MKTLIISTRLWQEVGTDTYAVKVDRLGSSETITALLECDARDPRAWRLIDRRDGHEIPRDTWCFAAAWAQTMLHQRLSDRGCSYMIDGGPRYVLASPAASAAILDAARRGGYLFGSRDAR